MALKEIPFYNIDSAVGPGCPNKPTDVMLVQFFLHQIYSHPRKTNKPAGPTIQINGRCDPVTTTWIKHFQNDLKSQSAKIGTDGRVDHANGEQYSFSSIPTRATRLHSYCSHYRRDHDYLEKHPLIPVELRAELMKGEPAPK